MKREMSSRTVTMMCKCAFAALASMLFLLTASASAGDRESDQVRPDPLKSCIDSCSGAECLRACIANERVSIHPTAVSSVRVADCTETALDNVRSCSRALLIPTDEADYEGFWVCVSVAGQVFLKKCPAFHSIVPGRSEDSLSRLGSLSLEWMIDAAERDVRLARAGVLDLAPPDPKGGVSTSPGGDQVTTAADDRQQEVQPSFQECAIELEANRAVCADVFKNDPDGRDDCNDGAKELFLQCIGAKEIK